LSLGLSESTSHILTLRASCYVWHRNWIANLFFYGTTKNCLELSRECMRNFHYIQGVASPCQRLFEHLSCCAKNAVRIGHPPFSKGAHHRSTTVQSACASCISTLSPQLLLMIRGRNIMSDVAETWSTKTKQYRALTYPSVPRASS